VGQFRDEVILLDFGEGGYGSTILIDTQSLKSLTSLGRVPVLVEKRNGAFSRLVQLTTNAPPGRAATGGTRHGQGYQGSGSSA
jgi:hypothetical protein